MRPNSRDFTIDVRRLRVLRELERSGTVSATAAALHLTPSAVSQQLAGLSREVGAPLLEKHGRGVRLTGQAKVLLQHAVLVQEQLERARADLAAWQEGVIGEVRVGSLSTGIASVVAPAYAALRRDRPGLDVRVVECDPPDVFSRLDAGDLDVVLTADHRGAPARHDPRYHRVDLLTDVLDVVLPAGHPLADEAGIRLAELADEVWVSAAGDTACAQITFGVCAAAGFTPDVRHPTVDWDAAASLVAAGAGVALVPRLAQPLRPAGLVVCPVLGAPAARSLFALVRAGAQTEPATAAVLGELRRVAAARPDAAELLAAT
ncbi:LysR family transcriptional regulator [Angustibacter aerolatus]